LKVLFNALPFQRGTDPQVVTLAYVEALRGFTAEAITEGIRKFLRGDCDAVSPKFVPTPPELARIVRSAVIPARVPTERRIAPFRYSDAGEKARMRLKMPMFAFAWSAGRMEELDRANSQGFEAMAALAMSWGIPVPQELFEDPHAERNWHAARNRALAEIERNPPPFMRKRGVYQEAAE
jgi:hypothetical protein